MLSTAKRLIGSAIVSTLMVGARAESETAETITVNLEPVSDYRAPSASSSWGQPPANGSDLPTGINTDTAVVFDDALPGRLPVVVDAPEGVENGYTLMWADLNGDGVYGTNEFVSLNGASSSGVIPAFRCLVEDAGHQRYVDFTGSLNIHGDMQWLSLFSSAAYEGIAHINGTRFAIRLQDQDGDGCVADFDGGKTSEEDGARLLWTIGEENPVSMETPLARTLGLLGQFFSVDLVLTGDVSAASAQLQLTHVEIPTYEVELSGSNVQDLAFSGKDTYLFLRPTNGLVAMPAGSWTVTGATVSERGQSFHAQPRRGRHALPVTVRAESRNALTVGGPLQHGVDVKGALTSGKVTMDLKPTTGVGGLVYTTTDDGGQVPPSWEVRRRGGDEPVASGNFEYG